MIAARNEPNIVTEPIFPYEAKRENIRIPHEPKVVYVHEVVLDRGILCDSRHCPIALALIQHFGHKEVLVSASQIWIKDNTYYCNYELRQKIKDIDNGLGSLPFHITLT